MNLNVKILIYWYLKLLIFDIWYYWYLKYFKIKSGIFYVDYSFVLHNNYKWVINLQINEQLIFFKLLILSLQLLCCLLRSLSSLLFILFCFIAELTRYSFARIQLNESAEYINCATLWTTLLDVNRALYIWWREDSENYFHSTFKNRAVKFMCHSLRRYSIVNIQYTLLGQFLILIFNLKAIYYFDINK